MEEPLLPHSLTLIQRYLSVGLSPVPRDQTDQQADQQHRDHDGEGEAEDAALRHLPAAVRLLDHDGLLLPPGGRRCKQSDADGAGVGVRVRWFHNEGGGGGGGPETIGVGVGPSRWGAREVDGGRLGGADAGCAKVVRR